MPRKPHRQDPCIEDKNPAPVVDPAQGSEFNLMILVSELGSDRPYLWYRIIKTRHTERPIASLSHCHRIIDGGSSSNRVLSGHGIERGHSVRWAVTDDDSFS